MPIPIEICVEGVESALAAQAGGADRVELCENLAVGGVTPGAGAIAVACTRLTIPVHVLIRPRAGDFCYSAVDFEVMRRDIETAQTLGASGVVMGILTASGSVDRERMGFLIASARPLSVTFHKAFDVVNNSEEALQDLIDLGIDRLLTSGAAPSAREGLSRLADLSRQAAGRVVIMAGGGIAEPDVPLLLAAGVRELHVGSSVCSANRTEASKVRRLREKVRSYAESDLAGGEGRLGRSGAP